MNGLIQMVLTKRTELWELFLEHMNMTILAVLIALVIGVPLGIAITKNRAAASIVIGVANLMQSIPAIALLAFSVPFVGIGEKPAILMVVVYALLPIIKNTYTGLTSIDPKMIEAARGIGLSKLQQLFQVQLPIAAPFIMAGIRISAVTSVGSMTIAAFAGAGGLGWFINMGLNANDPNLVLLGAIPASLLALLFDYVLAKLEKVVTPDGLKPPENIRKLDPKRRRLQRVVVCGLCAALVLFPVITKVMEQARRPQKTITVGASNYTEVYVLGEIYTQLIEANTDIAVDQKFGLNSTALLMSAIDSGDIDMYVSYTGTVVEAVLHESMEGTPDEVYDRVKTGMTEQYGLVTSAPLGFNNTYVLATTPEIAERYGLKTLSDIMRVAGQLRLGGTTEFIRREDNLPRLEAQFGSEFGGKTALESNIRYQALASGEVDAVDAFATDALPVKQNLVMMTDDIGFFPPYYAVNLVRSDTLQRYPELGPVLEKLDGRITEKRMAELNAMVDIDGMDPKEAARQFLLEEGLIPT